MAPTQSSTIHNNNYTNVHVIGRNVRLPAHPNSHPLVEDDEQPGHPASSSEGVSIWTQRMTTDPLLQLNKTINWEFSPWRANETDDQYNNWYNAHLWRIQNTQQSWNRSGYDIPPHIPQDQWNVPVTDPPEEICAEPTRICPLPLGWVQPRAAVNVCHQGEMLRAIHEMNMNVSDA